MEYILIVAAGAAMLIFGSLAVLGYAVIKAALEWGLD